MNEVFKQALRETFEVEKTRNYNSLFNFSKNKK